MGFFSWKTQDTNRSIANKHSNRPTFTVYMVNPITEECYEEDNYDGYGVFGGKDFYELLAEMNNLKGREAGINLAFSGRPYISPVLVENVDNWQKYKDHIPLNCDFQGFFYQDYNEDIEEPIFDEEEYYEDEE